MGEQYAPDTVQVILSMHPSRVQELASWMINNSFDGSRLREYAEQVRAQGHGKRLIVMEPTRDAAIEFAQKMGDYDGTMPGTDISRKINAIERVLRSLLTPPKPEEPTGLGAVVEDAEGTRWIRTCEPCERCLNKPWQCGGMHAHWQRVAAVRVLSAGIGEAE